MALPEGSGQIVVNGAAARHFHPGDKIIVVAYSVTDERISPQMVAVDEGNHFAKHLRHDELLEV